MVRSKLIVLLCFLGISADAQLNIKIGYGLGRVSAPVNNTLLSSYNDIQSQNLSDSLSLPFKSLSFLNGLEVGLRYKFSPNSGFELSWQGLSKSRMAVGEINNQTLFQKELFYRFRRYMLSYQSDFNGIGMGVGIGWNRVTIKDRIANSDFKETIVSQNQWVSKINLSFNFKSSDALVFSIQPFYQFSLSPIQLDRLFNELNVSLPDNTEDGFNMIGISFVFYNGPQ